MERPGSPEACNDGWATSCLRNARRVAKIIGPRIFTVTPPLGREAKCIYTQIRQIMREEA
jgi:hypothetical protein